MRFIYATVLSLALGSLASAQAIGNNRPAPPETFPRELLDGLRELIAAVKGLTTVNVEFGLSNNALGAVGLVCASALGCVVIAAVALVVVFPRRQA